MNFRQVFNQFSPLEWTYLIHGKEWFHLLKFRVQKRLFCRNNTSMRSYYFIWQKALKIFDNGDEGFKIRDFKGINNLLCFHNFYKLFIDRFPDKSKNIHNSIEHLSKFFFLFNCQRGFILIIIFQRSYDDVIYAFNCYWIETIQKILKECCVIRAAFRKKW